MKPLRSTVSWLCGLSCMAAIGVLALPAAADITQLQKDFQTPPDDARIMVRWWWFGPAVTANGIDRELRAMKAGGVGGAEIQPTYPLIVDGGTGDNAVKNLKWMSPEFLSMLGVTTAKAKELGMRMDLTLGSGWPYGGPMFTAAEGRQITANGGSGGACRADGRRSDDRPCRLLPRSPGRAGPLPRRTGWWPGCRRVKGET